MIKLILHEAPKQNIRKIQFETGNTELHRAMFQQFKCHIEIIEAYHIFIDLNLC